MPSTRICEWLPQIAHINIFVFAHKNANEPATSQRICGTLVLSNLRSTNACIIIIKFETVAELR